MNDDGIEDDGGGVMPVLKDYYFPFHSTRHICLSNATYY